jgi:integrase
MLRIPAACEKGNQDRVLPMAPEFAEFLLATPNDKRTGRVFNPLPLGRPHGERLCDYRVSEIVARIGKAAGVKVATKSKVDSPTGERMETVKYASAHDLRRSFGERWATRVMPTVLQGLMRHESIETTLRYYVGRKAQNTAKVLWEAHKRAGCGNTLGNSAASRAHSVIRAGDLSPDAESSCQIGSVGVEPPTKGL